MNIDEASDENKCVLRHIGFADVASLERYLLNDIELLPDLIDRSALTDKWLINHINGKLIDEVIMFKNSLLVDNSSLIKELLS